MKLPRIIGDDWINSGPLTSADFSGHAVLVYFWSYTCAASRRSLPYLKKWWERYSDKGLVIIGIHTPEFSFGKSKANVRKTVRELGIEWPIVLDNDLINWHDFKNEERPCRYLADQKGNLIYKSTDGNGFADTEQVIQGLVAASSPDLKLPRLVNHKHKHKKSCILPTPNLCIGNEQGAIINEEGYRLGEVYDYAKPDKIPEDCLALEGSWHTTEEYVESARAGAGLLLNFKGTEVNFIAQPIKTPASVKIFLNGKPLPRKFRGADLGLGGELMIKKPTLYNLARNKSPLKGNLEIVVQSGKLRAYAFSFYGCA